MKSKHYRAFKVTKKLNEFIIKNIDGIDYITEFYLHFDRPDGTVFGDVKVNRDGLVEIPFKAGYTGDSKRKIFSKKSIQTSLKIELGENRIEAGKNIEVRFEWIALLDDTIFARPETSGSSILVGT